MFGRNGLDVKTPDQIRRMRVAGMVVGETLALIRGQARAGMTTGDLDRTAEDFIRSKGATPSFLGYHGFTGSLCVSVNEEVVHGIPGSRILRDGDSGPHHGSTVPDAIVGHLGVLMHLGSDAMTHVVLNDAVGQTVRPRSVNDAVLHGRAHVIQRGSGC